MQVTITTDDHYEIIISGYCIEGSKTIGMLAVIYTQANDADIDYFLLTCLVNVKKCTWHFETISSGQYYVSVFMVEEGGLPFSRSAVKPKKLSIIREVDMISRSRYYIILLFTTINQ